MKIALMISMKHGMRQFIFRDISAFIEKGHDVRIFTLFNRPGLFNPLPEWEVVSVPWLPFIFAHLWFFIRHPVLYVQLLGTAVSSKSIADFAIAVSYVNQMKDIDLIYSYFGDHKLFISYYCKRILGIPLVTSIQAYELHKNPNPKMFKMALEYCDEVSTISDYNKGVLVDRWGLNANDIEVVRHIVNIDPKHIIDKIKILIVGYFAEKKGHEILFKALKQLNRDDVEVWVVGDLTSDVVGVDCRQLAKELDIESQVAFFGEQRGSALWALFRESDIFCIPSRTGHDGDQEGFPTVIAEAMAFGKPIIATRHAGIPEMVDDIYLADENNVDQLVAVLNKVLDAPQLRQELGEKNKELVQKNFSSANTNRLEQILLRNAKLPNSKHHSKVAVSDSTD